MNRVAQRGDSSSFFTAIEFIHTIVTTTIFASSIFPKFKLKLRFLRNIIIPKRIVSLLCFVCCTLSPSAFVWVPIIHLVVKFPWLMGNDVVGPRDYGWLSRLEVVIKQGAGWKCTNLANAILCRTTTQHHHCWTISSDFLFFYFDLLWSLTSIFTPHCENDVNVLR